MKENIPGYPGYSNKADIRKSIASTRDRIERMRVKNPHYSAQTEQIGHRENTSSYSGKVTGDFGPQTINRRSG